MTKKSFYKSVPAEKSLEKLMITMMEFILFCILDLHPLEKFKI